MHSFTNILIPTDFSQAAWNAVQLGLSMVGSESSKITLLHVFPSQARFSKGKKELPAADQEQVKSLQNQMSEFCSVLQRSTKAQICPVILEGDVEPEILSFLALNSFEIVIMGVNSNGTDNTPGSHLSPIIQNANAPVLVIPNQLSLAQIPA